MRHLEKIESVRGQVAAAWRAHGAPEGERTCETLLLRDGYYCGRRFACGPLSAVWSLEQDVIEIFGAENELLESIRPFASEHEPLRRAA